MFDYFIFLNGRKFLKLFKCFSVFQLEHRVVNISALYFASTAALVTAEHATSGLDTFNFASGGVLVRLGEEIF